MVVALAFLLLGRCCIRCPFSSGVLLSPSPVWAVLFLPLPSLVVLFSSPSFGWWCCFSPFPVVGDHHFSSPFVGVLLFFSPLCCLVLSSLASSLLILVWCGASSSVAWFLVSIFCWCCSCLPSIFAVVVFSPLLPFWVVGFLLFFWVVLFRCGVLFWVVLFFSSLLFGGGGLRTFFFLCYTSHSCAGVVFLSFGGVAFSSSSSASLGVVSSFLCNLNLHSLN